MEEYNAVDTQDPHMHSLMIRTYIYTLSLTEASLESQYSPNSHRPTLIASADVISSKLSMILRMMVGLFLMHGDHNGGAKQRESEMSAF